MTTIIVLAIAIALIAVLYSSVGHAGGSGYLAAMAIAGLAPDEMKPAALVLNIFVGAIGTYRFVRAGHFSWPTLWPFIATSIPMAIIGGAWRVPGYVYKPLIGGILGYAALMMIRRALADRVSGTEQVSTPRMPALPISLGVGGALGLLAGLTGTGGGIFLSPLLILLNWADAKRTAATSVAFVLLNSIFGLIGFIATVPVADGQSRISLDGLPAGIVWYIIAAIIGGTVGSGLGARRLPGTTIRVLLGVVLMIAAAKMFLTMFD